MEVHVQLTSLKTKLWCGCSADYRGAPPNSHTCPVCLGHPGTLPVLNKRAVEAAITLSLALGARVHPRMYFYRKNYFYPDMSKNFQISQYNKAGGVPFASGGQVKIKLGSVERVVTLDRLHLEGDPGRLVHQGSITTSPFTLVDYNRCCAALLEIVTNPDMRSPEEAREFLKQLKSIVMHCGVADLNLDGAIRVDANVSLRGTARTEVKNINSFKEVERALKFEIVRHKEALRRGKALVQETRHWDETRGVTVSLRTKETEMDYRYFPEPDLVPLEIPPEWIQKARSELPELPSARVRRLQDQYGLSEYDAEVLVSNKEMADFFEQAAKFTEDWKSLCNWMMGDVARRLNEANASIDHTKMKPEYLAQLVEMVNSGEITGKLAKKYVPEMLEGRTPKDIQRRRGDSRISDPKVIEEVVREAIEENPKALVDSEKKPRALEAIVGLCMKKTRGRADSSVTRSVLQDLVKAIRKELQARRSGLGDLLVNRDLLKEVLRAIPRR